MEYLALTFALAKAAKTVTKALPDSNLSTSSPTLTTKTSPWLKTQTLILPIIITSTNMATAAAKAQKLTILPISPRTQWKPHLTSLKCLNHHLRMIKMSLLSLDSQKDNIMHHQYVRLYKKALNHSRKHTISTRDQTLNKQLHPKVQLKNWKTPSKSSKSKRDPL